MSATFSKNLFDILGEDDEPRQPVAPVKEKKVVDAKPTGDKPAASSSKANAARSAGRGGRRGGRQQNDRPPRGRQFDRHSGTGIVDTEKKVTQGWGHPETAEAEAASDNAAANEAGAEKEAVEAAEPEENVKTLAEYQAELAAKRKTSVLEARKPNEGAEDKWKDAVALEKADEPEYYTPKDNKGTKKAAEKTRKEKVVIEIEQRFQERTRGGFRGNSERRGGDRGERRGRGNGRRVRQSNGPAINIQDSAAFPSLGATA